MRNPVSDGSDGQWWRDPSGQWHPTSSFPSAQTPMYAPAQTVYVTGPPRTSGTAVTALIIAILGWFFCPFLGGVLGLGIGWSARREIRRSGDAIVGDGMALAAMIISSVHIALVGLIVLFFVLVAAGLLGSTATHALVLFTP